MNLDQIEFANVIVLNKSDLVEDEQLKILKGIIFKLNSNAKIITTSFSSIEPKEILNTKLFDFEEAEKNSAWIDELKKDEHTPETEEYGISSFVYKTKKPFDPERFWKYLQENFNENIIRSKGLFWLASRPNQALIWSQAGGSLRAESAGIWWSSMTFQERIQSISFVENQEEIEKDWDIRYGDRKNEIVFIGKNMDQELITKELNMCLLNEIELQEKSWEKGYLDKWPVERVTNI